MFRRQPVWLAVLEALVLVGLIGWIDYATGWEWSFFMFYALPILLVTWRTNRRVGFAFAVLCALTWWVAQTESQPYRTTRGFAMAVAGRLFYFAVVAVAVSAVKTQRDLAWERIKDLERAQDLERDILRASEREQQRIGRDLHDNLGPHLAAIGYAATFLANDLREHDLPRAAKAEQIRELASDAVSLARDMTRGISHMPMDGAGLSIALEDLARTTSSVTGLSVSLHETGDTQVRNSEEGMHLYRIAQEALNNAAKHGNARNVTLILSRSEDSLRLAVADDGKGMRPSPGGTRGMGMHSMRYRARALGGELRIDSQPGEGTIVSCEIPNRAALPPAPAA